MSGGTNPLPFRPGGAADSPYEIVLKSLLQGYGTGLSSNPDAYVYAEAQAEARTIVYLWELSERLGNQFDPERMTDFLDRWVKILRIPIRPTDTDGEKRRKVGIKWAMRGAKPHAANFRRFLRDLLGDVFVEVRHYRATEAYGTFPGGLMIPGGPVLGDGPFASGICHLGIEVQQPAGMSDSDFFETADQIYPWFDGWLPAWVTFNWFKNGPSGDGFFLDDPQNLDVEAFA